MTAERRKISRAKNPSSRERLLPASETQRTLCETRIDCMRGTTRQHARQQYGLREAT
jgi:hypothetical protein